MISKEKEIDKLFEVVKTITSHGKRDIKGKRRQRNIVFATRAFAVIARNQFGFTLSELGRITCKNHATIIHHINKHETDYEYYPEYRDLFDKIYYSYLEKCQHPHIILRNILSNRDRVLKDIDLHINKIETTRTSIKKVEKAMIKLKERLTFNINNDGKKKNT